MRNVLLIGRRELRAYFATRIALWLLFASGLFCGFFLFTAGDESEIRHTMVPIFLLTGFRPAPGVPPIVLLTVGVARIVAVVLVPMIAARLFVEEKQTRTIELLFTSPASDSEIILGKWLGAAVLYLLILAVPLAELAFAGLTRGVDWWTLPQFCPALILPAFAVLAIGEGLSMSTRHQVLAAAGTMAAQAGLFWYFRDGLLTPIGSLSCAVLMLSGWFFTARSIRIHRSQLV
jgi:ABC-2 type transport system permease protein